MLIIVFLASVESALAQATQKISGVIEITSKIQVPLASYEEIARAGISDEVKNLGIDYFSPDHYDDFKSKATAYSLHFTISLDIYPDITRVVVRLLDGAKKTDLFTHAFYLQSNSSELLPQRAWKDVDLIKKEFLRRIRHLHSMYKQGDKRPQIFADCILPSKGPNQEDWNFSNYVTIRYAEELRSNVPAAQLGVFGIEPFLFKEWCEERTHDIFAPGTFSYKIAGHIFRVPSGFRLLVYFYGNDQVPRVMDVPVPAQYQDAPAMILNAVKSHIPER